MSTHQGGSRRGAMSLGECQAELEAAQQEISDLRDKYLRSAAAIENARRQAERNAEACVADRMRSFSLRLLEVADNLERALQHAPPGDALRPGVEATRQQLLTALRQEGVTPIDAQPGAAFDPQRHEAVAGHTADVAHDTVAEVMQTGYLFGDQVLRPARVVVATPARAEDGATSS